MDAAEPQPRAGGAAQGTNSLEATRRALAALAERAPGRPAMVVHTDIPGTLRQLPEMHTKPVFGLDPLSA